jgi:hypothetical protein
MGIAAVPLTVPVAERAAELRARPDSLRLPDALVLATAHEHAGVLLTYDAFDTPGSRSSCTASRGLGWCGRGRHGSRIRRWATRPDLHPRTFFSLIHCVGLGAEVRQAWKRNHTTPPRSVRCLHPPP